MQYIVNKQIERIEECGKTFFELSIIEVKVNSRVDNTAGVSYLIPIKTKESERTFKICTGQKYPIQAHYNQLFNYS